MTFKHIRAVSCTIIHHLYILPDVIDQMLTRLKTQSTHPEQQILLTGTAVQLGQRCAKLLFLPEWKDLIIVVFVNKICSHTCSSDQLPYQAMTQDISVLVLPNISVVRCHDVSALRRLLFPTKINILRIYVYILKLNFHLVWKSFDEETTEHQTSA